MLLQPKQRKFQKARKGRLTLRVGNHAIQKGLKHPYFTLKYGEFGLIAAVGARFHSRQIEAGRRTITSSLRRNGRLWIRAFPDTPVTAKPSDARMGKGKGSLSHWVAPLQSGQILYEISGVPEKDGIRALKAAAKKLPFPTRTVKRISFPTNLLDHKILHEILLYILYRKNRKKENLNYASNGYPYLPTSSFLACRSFPYLLSYCSRIYSPFF